MKKEKLDAHFITDPYNIRYLSKFTGSNGQILITKKGKTFLITDFRYLAVAKKVLPTNIKLVDMKGGLMKTLGKLATQNKINTLGFEEKNLTYQRYQIFKKHLPNLKLKPSHNLIEKQRMIKTEQEIQLIEKAQRIAEKVFLEVKKNLKVGKTEKQIAWEIEKLGHDFGADTISFAPIIGFNENSASPHHQNSDRKLKKGDVVLVDMGMMYQGYCSDMTRMIFTKQPTAQQKKIYNLVLEAQEAAIKKLKAGTMGSVGDEWSRAVIRQAGYGDTFGHSLGHGIGLEVHEAPYLSTGYEEPILENTIVTVEPGIYLDGFFGVRIEDMVLVKRDRVINLTKIPKEIDTCLKLL